MGVKYLAQEHNTVPRPGLEPGPFNPESSALTIRPPRLPSTGVGRGLNVQRAQFSNTNGQGCRLLVRKIK